MYPILFSIGPVTVYTYGVVVALSFLLGVFVATRLAAAENVDSQQILDLSFYCLIAAVVGSRLFFVIQNFEAYARHPLSAFKIWQGGLVYYGGLLAAAGTGIVYLKMENLPVMKIADFMAPGIAVGHALGRWSCFFAGCCYGKPTDLPWGITFTDIHSFAPKGVSLHPVQVYESMGELTIFGILMASRKWKRFDGQLFLSYLGLYSFLRFVTEFFRGDDRGHFFSEHLSPAQGISILVLATVAVSYLLSRRTKTAG